MKKLFLVDTKDEKFGIYYLYGNTKDKFTLKNVFTDENLIKPMSKYQIVKYLAENEIEIKKISEEDAQDIINLVKTKLNK